MMFCAMSVDVPRPGGMKPGPAEGADLISNPKRLPIDFVTRVVMKLIGFEELK
jgi:hypothetical protein